MKVLYCTDCGDILAPYREDGIPRKCRCGRHAIWWRDGGRGLASAWDRDGVFDAAWILGITNAFLGHRAVEMSAEDVQAIIDAHPDTYMFKTRRTCIVRIRPGRSSDTLWQELPEEAALEPIEFTFEQLRDERAMVMAAARSPKPRVTIVNEDGGRFSLWIPSAPVAD